MATDTSAGSTQHAREESTAGGARAAGPSSGSKVQAQLPGRDDEVVLTSRQELYQDLQQGPGSQVVLNLSAIVEHCRCSICMGVIKNTRAVSACMHRFCKDCIEAWLRTQIENNCPQCRVKFSSKRDCKPDPVFDLLLSTMFGDVIDFERRVLDPSAEVLERAKAVGQKIAEAKEQAAARCLSPQLAPHDGSHDQRLTPVDAMVHIVATGATAEPQATVDRHTVAGTQSGKRQAWIAPVPDTKRLRLGSPGEEYDALQYRGVRFQGDNWQARTKRSGKELSLGLYNSAEEAGMAYDLDRLHQQGGKAQRLNFPLLRQHYKQILSDLTDLHTPDGLLDFLALAVQAAVKAARNVPGATAPENTGPAAASMLNPRRTFPAAGQGAGMLHLPTSPPHLHTVAVGAATADWDLDDVRAVAVPAPADEHVMARQHAERLAMEHSLAAGLACSMAHIRLEAGSGCTWHMTCLACPATAAITQVSAAVALGIAQQHGLPPGQVQVGLAVANDLDATADFDALCYEDVGTGNLLLRGHVTIGELLGTLQVALEDLCLEYTVL